MKHEIKSLNDFSSHLKKNADKIKIEHHYCEWYSKDHCAWEKSLLSNSEILNSLEMYREVEENGFEENGFEENFYHFFKWLIEDEYDEALDDHVHPSLKEEDGHSNGEGSEFGKNDREEIDEEHDEEIDEEPDYDTIYWGVEVFLDSKKICLIDYNSTDLYESW
jgi:hypothetical protein